MNALSGIAQGLQVAGILQGIVLIAFVVIRVRDRSAVLLPALYFLSLIGGFALPLIGQDSGGWLVGILWLLSHALPAFGYLLVLQLVTDQMPSSRHWFVLAVPALAIPIITLATNLGDTPVCLTADPASCLNALEWLTVFDIVAGAGILLVLMLVINRKLPEMEELGLGREKRYLVVAIIGLMALLLALDLAAGFEMFAAERAILAGTVIRLTFFYLVASSIFRVFPTAFALPEPSLPAREAKRLSERKALNDEEQGYLKRVEDLMTLDKLYQEPGFSRKQLANELGIPEHQLSRIINTGLGKSFTDLINFHRVKEAKQLLEDTEQPVSQIAFDVGFNSLASFNRVFKTATDLSPTQYRREAQEGDGKQSGNGKLAAG